MFEDDAGLAAALEPFARCPDLMFVVDQRQRLVAVNPAAAAHSNRATEVLELVSPDARDTLATALQRALSAGEPGAFEWGEKGPGGVHRWFTANVTPVGTGDQIIGAIVSSRDITELKRTEERLRRSEQLMVDTQGVAHLGTWEWDITQPAATWSAELYRIYGLPPEGYTPSYEAYLTMVHPDDRQRVIDATNRVFHEHVPYSHDERIFRPDGSIRYLHTWANPVMDNDGKLLRLVGVCQDITDRKQIEEALHQLNLQLEARVSERTQQLETALRDLESFNSMVSHDLRAPLAVIQMAIEVIEREPNLPAKIPTTAARIRRAVENMSSLVTDLLALAQVGHHALEPTEIDLSAVSAEVVQELQAASPDRTVDIRIEPGLRARVDHTIFRSALANLIGNAWKYTAQASAPRIEVGVVHRSEGRALFVRDNGIGFDMKDMDRLFRPFTRLSNATGFKGTGIGLATVERVVQRHGGTLRAEGSLGEGATFFALLPSQAWC